ncbi:MAG: ATP-binding protein [Thermodesulfobacteriota bacterium]|nr:ATP-binding protein [Thermodesulfobacteriota bacterium]
MNKSKNVKVLLIEDNPGDARLIKEMVSEADGAEFDLKHVDRLSTGLKHLVAAEDIDLVLLDLGLPDNSGFDTFTSIQAQVPGVAIIVLTGFENETIENKALQAGAQDYLSKNQLDSNSLIRSMRYAIERKKAERRIEHLNSVLKAIRNVNQLIIVEKDRDSLLQKASEALIETRAYNAAWFGFLQDDETFTTVMGSGFGKNVSRFCRHVMKGDHPPCIKKALAQKNHLVVLDKSKDCGDCFFKDACANKDAVIIRVEHAGRFLGLLAVWFAPYVTIDDEEKGLLQEVAGDIGLSLHNMALEESRRQTEKTLQESKSRYKYLYSMVRLMCDNLPDLIWTKDLEGKFVFGNKAFCEKMLNAKDTDELIGKTDIYFADRERESHPENPDYHTYGETCLATDLAVMKSKRLRKFEESGYLKGKFLVFDVYKAPFWDEKHNMIGMVGCAKDVTKEKQLEKEHKQAEKELAKYRNHLEVLVKERTYDLEAAQEELVKREKLSVLGQLTATVSHEIRNPLGVIRSSAFYLQRKIEGAVDEKIAKHLNRIEEQVSLCDTIVGDLLEFTRGRRSEVIHGEINPLLEKVLEEIATPEQVTLVSDLSPELPMILFDRDKMRRVVINLVLNAFKAVTLRWEKGEKEDKCKSLYQPLVKVTSSKADNGIRIEVEDNGTGMDDETARRAFEPLFTTWARGTGLGLAIVKKIVEEHCGSVSSESKLNHGTKVTIIIPTENEKLRIN